MTTYDSAVAAEGEGKYHDALRLYQSILSADDTSRDADHQKKIKNDIQRVIDVMYGPKGSEETVCVWKNAPLLSKKTPPPLQFRASCQMGNKIYVHGGCDFCENDVCTGEIADEVWQYDIDDRKWTKIPTAGSSPGPRCGHTMFSWKGDLYLWGGMQEKKSVCRMFFTKLYRLKLSSGMQGKKNKAAYMWEIVKVRSQEPTGREEHAAVLYKGKYYIHGGNNPHIEGSALKDTWVLNLSNFKWSPLKDGPIIRHCHGMWAANNKLYVLGGRTSTGAEVTFTFKDAMLTNPSIEEFVSFDLESKVWKKEECVGSIRPHPLSEFPVLPLYDNDEDEEPSSVLIWGGYAEPDAEAFKAKVYGEEQEEFRLPYRKRLLRFDVSTNVWKSIVTTTPILPKALAIMAMVKRDNGVRHVLIGEGYGYDPDTNDREWSEKANAEWQSIYAIRRALGESGLPEGDPAKALPDGGCKPQYSHKMYDVQITEGFGCRGSSENTGWSWDLYNLPDEEMPKMFSELGPCSPALHHITDLSVDDFVQPPCAQVIADDEKNLFGMRVLIHGLQGRKDLNGMIGRCGRWLKSERYEVFLPLYECGGEGGSLSVKPQNLQIADPVAEEECVDFVTRNPHIRKSFPGIFFILIRHHADKRPLMEFFSDPALTSTTTSYPDEGIMTHFDTYRGPLSSRAYAVIRTMMDPSKNNVNESLICCNLIPPSLAKTNKEKAFAAMNVFANFVRDLKERDSVRISSFEASLSEITDDIVEEKSGGWLKIDVQLDGIRPKVRRELLVNPAVTMRALHDQVLCPTMGWKSNFHFYSFRKTYDDPEKLKDSCWIGPRQSTALDSMFMPLYVGGCVANDKQISIGQLFASEDTDVVTLNWVHDLGDWYSHQITISKYDGQKPDSNVACLVQGEGLGVPEDSGGLMGYCETMRGLTGKMPIEIDENTHAKAFVDPSSEHWWRYFNAEVRNKYNMQSGLGDPLQFDIDRARNDLDAAIRRPTQKSGREALNLSSIDRNSGLTLEQDKKVSVSLPKNATKMCAVCGVTVALRKCSGCQSVAYCSREHQLQHWKEHKADCKVIQRGLFRF